AISRARVRPRLSDRVRPSVPVHVPTRAGAPGDMPADVGLAVAGVAPVETMVATAFDGPSTAALCEATNSRIAREEKNASSDRRQVSSSAFSRTFSGSVTNPAAL